MVIGIEWVLYQGFVPILQTPFKARGSKRCVSTSATNFVPRANYRCVAWQKDATMKRLQYMVSKCVNKAPEVFHQVCLIDHACSLLGILYDGLRTHSLVSDRGQETTVT